MGDFAGPKALRAVGRYLSRDETPRSSAFYLSNVEEYLKQDGKQKTFCENASTLPIDDTSTFIRSSRSGTPDFGFELVSELGIDDRPTWRRVCAVNDVRSREVQNVATELGRACQGRPTKGDRMRAKVLMTATTDGRDEPRAARAGPPPGGGGQGRGGAGRGPQTPPLIMTSHGLGRRRRDPRQVHAGGRPDGAVARP